MRELIQEKKIQEVISLLLYWGRKLIFEKSPHIPLNLPLNWQCHLKF
jgi:hypothetical protein